MTDPKNESPQSATSEPGDRPDAKATELVHVQAQAPEGSYEAMVTAYRANAIYASGTVGPIVVMEHAELVKFGHRYQSLLEAALDKASSLDDLQKLDFAIKRRLDIHRQSQQYAHLFVKLEKMRDNMD